MYLNIVQFGPDTYGVAAASQRYFGRTPADLTRTQAARLAAAPPNPRVYRVESPSPRIQRRANWIAIQMRQLGGTAWLRDL